MTHSLHRCGDKKSLQEDFVVLTFGHTKKPTGAISSSKTLLKNKIPGLYDKIKNIYKATGIAKAIRIIKNIKFKNELTGPFVLSSPKELYKILRKMKRKKSGRSVVVSGVVEDVTNALARMDLYPHTVQYSLGYFGKLDLLPNNETLELTTMCGHHMISPQLVENLLSAVRKKKLTGKEATEAMSKLCVCGIFNQERALKIIDGLTRQRIPKEAL
jgi:hypothetical protein